MRSGSGVCTRTLAGLFFVTLATLMYEILLTRIFSVTMWYHFAFMAISITMFGMTLGALIVYLVPAWFSRARIHDQLTLSALLFSLFIVISCLIHLNVPFNPRWTPAGIGSMALTYAAISLPFIFSGIAVSLALSRFPADVGRLYAADLVGAAAGCLLLRYILEIMDGPGAVLAVAALAALGALFFAGREVGGKVRSLALTACLAFVLLTGINIFLFQQQHPLLRVKWVKDRPEMRLIYEKWSSFARVAIRHDRLQQPIGWGMSDIWIPRQNVDQLYMDIDAAASTVLTSFNGNLREREYLRYDITNLAHYLRPRSDVLVIGTGGGRDILSALVFDQKSVTGIEINGDILHAVNRTFGDFTGHLDRDPRVTFIRDEARSYVSRLKTRFDIIQVSLIDTWAATAAGAFVLAENSLYTLEAWENFLRHLRSDGILTFSRWYNGGLPAEMYRLTSLAAGALRRLGNTEPERHILIARHMLPKYDRRLGIGTMLVSASPFSDRDIDEWQRVCDRLHFEMVLSPRSAADANFATIASGRDLQAFTAAFPLNISPPTDDNPFFFNMLRLRDAIKPRLWQKELDLSFNLRAVAVLGILLTIVLLLTLLCIAVPLGLTVRRTPLRGTWPDFLYFASIGFGFMLVEISQMQRLNVFLGHPNYGLSVVLFSLLLASGIGSFLTAKLKWLAANTRNVWPLVLLLGLLLLFGKLTPLVTSSLAGASTPLRIAVAVGLLFPLGIFMGMAFPLGLRWVADRAHALTPWLWGINGATSVFASVLATAIALSSGIAASFWTGFVFYGLALLAYTLSPLTSAYENVL